MEGSLNVIRNLKCKTFSSWWSVILQPCSAGHSIPLHIVLLSRKRVIPATVTESASPQYLFFWKVSDYSLWDWREIDFRANFTGSFTLGNTKMVILTCIIYEKIRSPHPFALNLHFWSDGCVHAHAGAGVELSKAQASFFPRAKIETIHHYYSGNHYSALIILYLICYSF